MKFLLRLIFAFALAPLFGALIANLPSSLLISLLTENGGSAYGWYAILTTGALIYGYMMMLPGIVVIGFFAHRNVKWYLYALTGAFFALIASLPIVLFLEDKFLAACLFITMLLNGIFIGLASYFIMRRPVLANQKEKP